MIINHMSESGVVLSEPTRGDLRNFVYALENELKKREQFEISVEHEFADGLYSRKIMIPKGAWLTGKVHKQNDLNIVIYGDISVLTEMGLRRLRGHNCFPGKAGLKQFGIAHEDTLWITVHHTHLTDLDEIEKELFEEEERVFDFKTGKVCQSWLAKSDYLKVLQESGIPQEQAWLETVNEEDLDHSEMQDICLDNSEIHGTGVFAARDFVCGEPIGFATIGEKRTKLGRFTNHSHNPNAKPVVNNNSILFVASCDICNGAEVTINYREALSLRGRMVY